MRKITPMPVSPIISGCKKFAMKNKYSQTWFDTFLSQVPEAVTDLEIAFIQRQIPLPAYRQIVDLCCGYGRHAHRLAAMGYLVTAVDRDAKVISQSRRVENSNIARVCEDMRRFADIPGSGFDAVLILWQSFGYFDPLTNLGILHQINARLFPHGRLVLDIYNREYFDLHQGEWTYSRNGKAITERKSIQGSRLEVTLEYHDSGEKDSFSWQIFTPGGITDFVERAGFHTALICANFQEDTLPSADIPRMQVVIEKDH
jgi:SAM-dependent methyltransferase